MSRPKKAKTNAAKCAEYRKRKAKARKAEKAAQEKSTTPYLSRASRVPRLPLAVWQRAAEALISGEGSIREKVQMVQARCAVDADWKSQVNKFAKENTIEQLKKEAKAKGLAMVGDDFVPMFKGDEPGLTLHWRLVYAMESERDPVRRAELVAAINRKYEGDPDVEEQRLAEEAELTALVAEIEKRGTGTYIHPVPGGPRPTVAVQTLGMPDLQSPTAGINGMVVNRTVEVPADGLSEALRAIYYSPVAAAGHGRPSGPDYPPTPGWPKDDI